MTLVVGGLAAVTAAQMAAYVAVEPFVREGLQPETVRALVYLESFRSSDAKALAGTT